MRNLVSQVLKVQYTTEIGIDCGVELTANETKDQPGIAFKAANPDKLHTLVMFDVIFPIEISWLRQQPSAFYQFCDTLGVADFSWWLETWPFMWSTNRVRNDFFHCIEHSDWKLEVSYWIWLPETGI
ncbi:hypothetical protein TNCT_568501 [Trichonephila clavata]|uniref:Uncharacterized protein n=1 Tax=Trichonephila clavata TaxID=2740835 RepID=A0A8X6KQ50_TRICU|nr:hypothetical protein TNCT_568501 [Trichonephila clavata]